jgi:hypothetical protein
VASGFGRPRRSSRSWLCRLAEGSYFGTHDDLLHDGEASGIDTNLLDLALYVHETAIRPERLDGEPYWMVPLAVARDKAGAWGVGA